MKKNLDPVKYCPMYLTQSCNCVDGIGCDINDCFIIKSNLKKQKVTFLASNNQYSGFINSYENGKFHITEYEYLDEYVYDIKDYNKKFFLT